MVEPGGRAHGRGRAGRARRRRAGRVRHRAACARRDRTPTSPRSSRCPRRPTSRRCTRRWGSRGARPSCARRRSRGEPPALVEVADIRGDLHCHTTWSDGRNSVEEMARGRDRARLRLHRDLRPHAGGRRRARADAGRRAPAGGGDRRRQRAAGAVPRAARHRVRHPPRRPARPPRRRARGARLGAGERPRRPADAGAGDDRARRGGAAQPVRALPFATRPGG